MDLCGAHARLGWHVLSRQQTADTIKSSTHNYSWLIWCITTVPSLNFKSQCNYFIDPMQLIAYILFNNKNNYN